jgi:uncharacterized phiE125 gp8 family phage protein
VPNLTTVTPTAANLLPVKVEELAAHLRLGVPDAALTTQLAALLAAARDYIEGQTGHSLAPATYRETLIPRKAVQLLRGPTVSAVSLRYWPASGGEQVVITGASLADYAVALIGFLPGEVILRDATLALELADRPDALSLDYIAGHAADECPPGLKQALLLLAALWHEERLPVNIDNIVNELPYGLQHLITHHRAGGWVG